MRKLAFTIACAAFLCAGTAAANSQEQMDAPLSTDSAKERRFDVRLGTGAPMMVSLSIAGRPFEQPLTLDAGLWVFAFSQGGYARVGWASGLFDHRDDKARGATLELTPMIGVLSGIAGGDTVSGFVVPEAVVSLDWTWWFSKHFGLGATATLGAILTAAYAEEIDTPLFPDARLAIGASF